MKSHTKLSFEERKLLAFWKNSGVSNKECARRLNRSASTIGRELKRNGHRAQEVASYEPYQAQAKTDKRKERAWGAKHSLKNAKVFRYVIARLMRGWSPEQIAGRLAYRHPDDPSWHICHETIYRFIYSPEQRSRRWWEYLRRGQKKRRKKGGRKVHRCRIPDRVSIHQRPAEVDERVEIGHWEGDTVVGKGQNHGLHTEYERVSSLTRILPMEDMTANSSVNAQIRIFSYYPREARKTTTLDNGHEHVSHPKLKRVLGMQTYFADPYSSWQRGGNENANLWIRYYFPKGTDFRTISLDEIKSVEWELNNRPRKRLGFKTPQEVFNELLRGCNCS